MKNISERVPTPAKSNVRVLVVNHTLDASNSLLGHQHGVAKAISKEFQNFFVFTSAPPNKQVIDLDFFVSSHNSRYRLVKAYKLTRDFLKVLIDFRPDLVFFHMTPNHCSIFAPILKLLNIRIFLWYAHKSTPRTLYLSSKIVDKILIPSKGSISLNSSKIYVTGHHVDFDFFYARPKFELGENAISVGRLDFSKRIKEMIEAISTCKTNGLNLKYRLVGKPSSKEDSDYMEANCFQAVKESISFRVDEIPNKLDLRDAIQQSDIFIHASLGSLDKAPIEALSAGLPVASVNEEFTRDFGTWSDLFPVTLSQEIEAIYSLSSDKRTSCIASRQKIASEIHSLSNWALNFRVLAEDGKCKSSRA